MGFIQDMRRPQIRRAPCWKSGTKSGTNTGSGENWPTINNFSGDSTGPKMDTRSRKIYEFSTLRI